MVASLAVAAAASAAHGQTFVPIILNNSSFSVDIVVEKGSLVNTISKVTASMDNGTANPGNNTWFEQGFDPNNPTHGLPPSGAVFTSQNDSNHQFKMQSYGPVAGDTGTTHNNALLLGDVNATANTLTLSNPQPYSQMSVLAASGNGTGTYTVTVDYTDGAPSSVITGVSTPDWFGSGAVAWDAHGRVVPNSGTASPQNNGNDPLLYQEDFTVPDSLDPVKDIVFTNFTSSGGGRTAIFAVSGVATAASTTITYTGTAAPNAGIFDGTSLNFKNAAGNPTSFVTGNLVVFDDSATGTHNVTVAMAGVQPSTVTFNNTTASAPYVFNGGPIAGGATVAFNGSGMTTFNNSNTYLGDTDVNAGTFVIGAGGSFASSNIVVANGATFSITGSAQSTAFTLVNNGTTNFNSSTRTLTSLQGSGTVNLAGTALTAGSGSNFTGTFGGTGGSFNLTGGSLSLSSQSQISALSSLSVSSTGSVILTANGPFGSSAIPLILGPQSTLTTANNVNAVYNGPITVTGPTTLSAGADDTGSSSLTISGVISGTGSITLANIGQGATPAGPEVILNAVNTYTGETDLAGNGSQLDYVSVQIGVDNGLSANAGFAFTTTSTFGLTLDLNGHNQSVQYLTGAISATNVITTSTGSSTLTISNGNNGSIASVFGASITGPLSVNKTGSGNQIFIGTGNTYTGNTTITGGTLTAGVPTAFGTSPITLNGGRLGLATQAAGSTRLTGFSNFVETTNTIANSNGGAGTYTSTALTLTTGLNSQANSAFTSTPQNIPSAGFVAKFGYTTTGGADGVAFVIQNDPRGASAVGGAGGGLGYGSNNNGVYINNSLAFEINIYSPNVIGTAVGTNGSVPAAFTPVTGVNLADGGEHDFTVIYNAGTQTVSESIDNGAYSNTFFGINLASLLGGNGSSGYVGFTGGTGGLTSTQTVNSFTFSNVVSVPVSIGNTVTATAGTTSGITFPVTASAANVSIGALTIPATAKVFISTTNTAGNAGSGVLVVPSFTNSGTLNVNANAADIQGSTIAAITAMAQSGFAGGTFNGSGITSAAAAANASHTTAVGVILNNVNGTQLYGTGTALGLFDGAGGVSPGLSDVLVKYTYFGDANLDGKVDGSDYSLIDSAYTANKTSPGSATGWYNGDFNYDGVVDGSDYTLIDNAFNAQGSIISAGSNAQIAAQVAGSAVPEPASLSLIGIAAAGLLGRRRK